MGLRGRVIEYRAEHGYTIDDFAERCGVSSPTIIKIERGEKVSRLVVAKVANALGIGFREAEQEEME